MCVNTKNAVLLQTAKATIYRPDKPHRKQKARIILDERLVATVNPSMSSSTESINDEFQTLDVGKLNLCYSNTSSTKLLHNMCSELKCKDIDDTGVSECFKDITKQSPDSPDLLEAVRTCSKELNSHLSYQIVGDNVDLEVKVRRMSDDNKNKSLHYFNLVAFLKIK